MSEAVTECEYFGNCKVFKRFVSEGLANVWIVSYCRGPRMAVCERRKRRILDQPCPDDLLPDGSKLKDNDPGA
jgi:hypothetical protein